MRRTTLSRRGLLWIGSWLVGIGFGSAPVAADEVATDDLSVRRFMVFVPAKDFALSKRF